MEFLDEYVKYQDSFTHASPKYAKFLAINSIILSIGPAGHIGLGFTQMNSFAHVIGSQACRKSTAVNLFRRILPHQTLPAFNSSAKLIELLAENDPHDRIEGHKMITKKDAAGNVLKDEAGNPIKIEVPDPNSDVPAQPNLPSIWVPDEMSVIYERFAQKYNADALAILCSAYSGREVAAAISGKGPKKRISKCPCPSIVGPIIGEALRRFSTTSNAFEGYASRFINCEDREHYDGIPLALKWDNHHFQALRGILEQISQWRWAIRIPDRILEMSEKWYIENRNGENYPTEFEGYIQRHQEYLWKFSVAFAYIRWIEETTKTVPIINSTAHATSAINLIETELEKADGYGHRRTRSGVQYSAERGGMHRRPEDPDSNGTLFPSDAAIGEEGFNPHFLLVSVADYEAALPFIEDSLKTTAEIFSHVNEGEWTGIVRDSLTRRKYKEDWRDSEDLSSRIRCGGPENRRAAYYELRDDHKICAYRKGKSRKLFVCNLGLHPEVGPCPPGCHDSHPFPADLLPKGHMEEKTSAEADTIKIVNVKEALAESERRTSNGDENNG